MGRLEYVCATCEEHFTRRYSATRHNVAIHGNRGEIVSLLEYLVGRSSGRYQARNPFWYRRRKRNVGGSTTVADSMAEQQGRYHQQSLAEEERYRQEQSMSASIPSSPAATQYHPQDDLLCPTDRSFQSQSMDITDDEEKTTTLSHETRLKIEELKRLVYKYPQYHSNPGGVIACVIHFCNEGDNSFLNDKLEQLRMIDSAMGYTHM